MHRFSFNCLCSPSKQLIFTSFVNYFNFGFNGTIPFNNLIPTFKEMLAV